jgi:hypothetical protein
VEQKLEKLEAATPEPSRKEGNPISRRTFLDRPTTRLLQKWSHFGLSKMTDFISTPPCVVTFQHVTLEELSSTLAEQPNDQDRYALAEKIIVDQVNYRDTLLAEQRPGIKENYKLHLDFGEVKGLSDLDSTEYHGS